VKSLITLRAGNAWVHTIAYHVAAAPHVIVDAPPSCRPLAFEQEGFCSLQTSCMPCENFRTAQNRRVCDLCRGRNRDRGRRPILAASHADGPSYAKRLKEPSAELSGQAAKSRF
jgi:hypothetical protein